MKKSTKKLLFIGIGVIAAVIIAFVAYDAGRESDHYEVKKPNYKLDEKGRWVEKENSKKKGDNSAQGSAQNSDNNVSTSISTPTNEGPTFVPKTITKTITNKCMFCTNGKCRACGGYGGTFNSYTKIYYPCTACAATSTPGLCKYCGGTGETSMLVTFYPDGSAIGIDTHTGQVYNSVPGAATNLTSEEREELRENKKLRDQGNYEYMDKIEYAPDYVADNRKIPCPQCGGKSTYRHSHIKVRIR